MTRQEIKRALEKARRTGIVPLVAEKDMPMLKREARKMGLRVGPTEPIKRSPNDCMRMAISHACGIPYEALPSSDPGVGDPEAKRRTIAVWEAWAARHGLRFWFSDKLAPVGVSRWIAGVPSRLHPGESHAVVMEFDRLDFDSNAPSPRAWTHVGPADVLHAYMLLPVSSPIWQANIKYWPINVGRGVDLDDAEA